MTSGSEAGYVNPDYESQLLAWLKRSLAELALNTDTSVLTMAALGGDAGFRRYFRLGLDSVKLLGVYAPPSTENNEAFLAIARFLSEQGIHVPKILAHDLEQGFFLIEDLGEKLYLDYLTPDSVNVLYGEALIALLRIQQSPLDRQIFPEYNHERLQAEMALFPKWFVGKLLAYSLDDDEQSLIQQMSSVLLDSALAQPCVVVHRDFHSRNIVYGVSGTPGVIDFQDAVIGPLTYDLVSLLKDCYVYWPQEQVKAWALAYGNMALDAEILSEVSEEQFLRWFDLMGMQRHIKVLGIFARLSLRDGKHSYLHDLPLVVKYVRELQGRYPELSVFHDWFESTLMPLISRQAWWGDMQ